MHSHGQATKAVVVAFLQNKLNACVVAVVFVAINIVIVMYLS